jgi:hypothetical protein
MKMSNAAFQLALLVSGGTIILTAFILREAFHVHREPSVYLGILVGATLLFVLLKTGRRAQR